MIKLHLRLLLITAVLLLASGGTALPGRAAQPLPGNEHWADDLSVAGFDGYIFALASDNQGNLYAGGDFTSIDGKLVNHVARWDGSSWSALGGGLGERANKLAVDSQGNLYADNLLIPGGGMPETRVMRWDGTVWAPLAGDLSRLVDTLERGRESNIVITDLVIDSRDQLYAGGFFYKSMTESYVGYVARWDGSDWALVGSGMNHTVYQLAIDGQDSLYAAGEFTSAGGTAVSRIAKWDGTAWSPLGGGLDGQPIVTDMAADQDGKVYVAGQLETEDGMPTRLILRWDGAAWQDLAPGEQLGWFEGSLGTIFDLEISPSGELYAGGEFAMIDGVEAHNIARWDGTGWSALSSATGDGVNERVFAVSADAGGQVFVGGYFTQAGGLPANRFARWDGSSWSAGDRDQGAGMNNLVLAIAVEPRGAVYAGGYFTAAGLADANYIARWDGAAWEPLGGGTDGAVHTLLLDGRGGLYAGGDFTFAGDTLVHAVAYWDGTAWHRLGRGMTAAQGSPQVRALALDNQGNLYAGGNFTTAGGVSARNIARWDGKSWSPLGSGLNEPVVDLVVDPQGNVYAAGWFSRAGSVEARGVARWDGESWSAMGGEADTVTALALGLDGEIYAGGVFSLPDGSGVEYIARWDGSSWRPLAGSLDNYVNDLAVGPAGELYAGGNFSQAGEEPALRVARWDGTSWSSLGSGIGEAGDNSIVTALAADERGNLYIGGQLTTAGGKPSTYLAKWCAELKDGGCTFAFEAQAVTPDPTGAPAAETPAVETPGPVATPAAADTDEPAPGATAAPAAQPGEPAPAASRTTNLWAGAGLVLVLVLAGLFFFMRPR